MHWRWRTLAWLQATQGRLVVQLALAGAGARGEKKKCPSDQMGTKSAGRATSRGGGSGKLGRQMLAGSCAVHKAGDRVRFL